MIAGWLATVVTLAAAPVDAGEQSASQSSDAVPTAKQTSLGLYVTSIEAHEKWMAAPELVNILDVRTPEEFIFVGHAEVAWNIPFAFQTYRWDPDKQRFDMQLNPEFISEVEQWANPTDTILIMCRSGGRSAMAVNALADAGFTNVYNIIDGMEGDKVNDPESLFHGKRQDASGGK
jgi:rhodanese-related sulfurtransferase